MKIAIIITGLACVLAIMWFVRPKYIVHRVTFVEAEMMWHEATMTTDDGWQLGIENNIRNWFELDRKDRVMVTERNNLREYTHPYLINHEVKTAANERKWEIVAIEEYTPSEIMDETGYKSHVSGLVYMGMTKKDAISGKIRLGAAKTFYFDKTATIVWKMTKEEDGLRNYGLP